MGKFGNGKNGSLKNGTIENVGNMVFSPNSLRAVEVLAVSLDNVVVMAGNAAIVVVGGSSRGHGSRGTANRGSTHPGYHLSILLFGTDLQFIFRPRSFDPAFKFKGFI